MPDVRNAAHLVRVGRGHWLLALIQQSRDLTTVRLDSLGLVARCTLLLSSRAFAGRGLPLGTLLWSHSRGGSNGYLPCGGNDVALVSGYGKEIEPEWDHSRTGGECQYPVALAVLLPKRSDAHGATESLQAREMGGGFECVFIVIELAPRGLGLLAHKPHHQWFDVNVVDVALHGRGQCTVVGAEVAHQVERVVFSHVLDGVSDGSGVEWMGTPPTIVVPHVGIHLLRALQQERRCG